jgi:hypothetical protein
VPEREFTDADVDAALEALTDPARFREAELRVARMAPQLQRVLSHALREGGWFEEHESQVLKAATTPDEEARLTAVRTLLAEEAGLVMLVGVTVGWELARALEGIHDD